MDASPNARTVLTHVGTVSVAHGDNPVISRWRPEENLDVVFFSNWVLRIWDSPVQTRVFYSKSLIG